MREDERVQPLDDRLGALFAVVLVVMVAVPWALAVIGVFLPESWPEGLRINLSILAQDGVLAWITLRRLRRLGIAWSDLRPYIESAAQGLRAFGWGVSLLFLNGLAAQLSALAVEALVGVEALERLIEREQAAVARLLDPEGGPVQLGITVFLAVGAAPIVEELFFRGYAYPVLKRHAGRHGIWLSALLFAGVHLYVVNFLPIFLLGLVLAHVYEQTRSLAVPIVAHATVNGLVAVISVAVQGAGA